MSHPAPEYVLARTVLLDALEVLEPHRASLVLVGAQAIYLHAGSADFAVAPMTTDADLVLRVSSLADTPEIAGLMAGHGFRPTGQPGTWVGQAGVAIDLMVAPHESGRSEGARSASIPEHADGVARIAHGMEPALIDHGSRAISALEPADKRLFNVSVAGPAALLVSKLIKLRERLADADRHPRRVQPKDALDIMRLLRLDPGKLSRGFELHQTDGHSKSASDEALEFLRTDAMARRPRLSRLASDAVGEDAVIEAQFTALAQELLASVQRI